MQTHHQSLARSDSPVDSHNSGLHRTQPQDSMLYNHQNGMYSNSNHPVHILPEYIADHDSQNISHQQQPKLDGFSANAYRSTFTSYPNATRPRHQNNRSILASNSYRDTPSFYPTSASEVFTSQMTSPVQSHMQAFEPRASYDFGSSQAGINGGGGGQKLYHDLYNPSAGMLQSHQLNGNKSQQQQAQHSAYSASYSNNLHLSSQTPYGPHVPAAGSQSAGNGTNVGAGSGAPPGLAPPSSINMANGNGGSGNSEEISTIFVVGFPEDMQEREFQNMFTFSHGFEAATLKIPNKEYTAYGGVVGGSSGNGASGLRGSGYSGYVGPNDPYNLVTVNQGGVVVDGGRDGTMTSWPAAVPADDVGGGHFLGNAGLGGNGGGAASGLNMPPRKQIIGFAKFRSREEALGARDLLQGRRVDIEKGAVLKAEMAKKNLHTKRGVGPVPGNSSNAAVTGTGSGGSSGGNALGAGGVNMAGLQQTSIMNGAGLGSGGTLDSYGINAGGSDTMTVRERELGALGAMGLMGTGRLNQWRDQIQQQPQDHLHTNVGSNGLLNGSITPGREDEERRAGLINAMGLGSGTRGPRERAEEDERERRRKDEEERERRRKEKEMLRLRAGNSTAFDAFHSVPSVIAASPPNAPPGIISRHMSNTSTAGMLTSLENGYAGGAGPNGFGSVHHHMLGQASVAQQHDEMVGPWDSVRSQESTRPRSSSQRSISPADAPSGLHHGPPFRHLYSPPPDQQRHLQFLEQAQHENQQRQQYEQHGSGVTRALTNSESSSSSVMDGSQSGIRGGGGGGESDGGGTDREMSRALGELEVSTTNGKVSPQLPSPASGASSASARNAVDQNPPINTLYVGNLPTSPPPSGFPQDHLEESLRELFSKRPGFRRLCFRQKANGPMCFVEFDDVPCATKALNDLYGNNLKGLVKGGGIRLSYSKNPLGVRTPPGSNTSSLQQQQLQSSNNINNNYQTPFSSDNIQPRITEEQQSRPPTILRRDLSVTSPSLSTAHHSQPSGFNNFPVSNPPPRFYSSSPSSSTTFGPSSGSTPLSSASSTFMPRSSGSMSVYGFTLPSSGNIGGQPSTTFSPFGLSSTPPPYSIPDHQSTSDDHPISAHTFVHRTLSPPANNLEAARAG